MDPKHPLKEAADVETGLGAEKLAKFKERLQTDQVVNFFKSPEDLRAHVINSLSKISRERNLAELHYISDIPTPPDAYIAHPYTLLQTGNLVGRQRELNILTNWVTRPTTPIYSARILNVVAIGGMGKSALTWKWFNDIAPRMMRPLAGRLWWSFYESDASFENFVIRALAYVTRRSKEEILKITPPERETQLLASLDKEPFLVVLDGLERILVAYARMDASHLADDDLDQSTANYVVGAFGLSESAGQLFTGQHQLRKTADPRAGGFLRKLVNVRAARVLVSTRLYPADLQMVTGGSIPNAGALFVPGLSDDDAMSLWRAFGVSGSRDGLLPLFHTFDNYPLLIRALAGEVARFRRAPGDFEAWRKANPNFNPFQLDKMKQQENKSHVLQYALQGLDDSARRVLHTVAAFRMPATYDTLATLLIGKDKPFANENFLDETLTELEDRGLIGWDRRANRYDLHPIVRGIAWEQLSKDAQRAVYTDLYRHFEAELTYTTYSKNKIEALDDLTTAIEMYNVLVGLGRYDAAISLFANRLVQPLLHRLSNTRKQAELLEMLFPNGITNSPYVTEPSLQAFIFDALALAYHKGGKPSLAVTLYRKRLTLSKDFLELSTHINFEGFSDALRLSGAFYESEFVALLGLDTARKLSTSTYEEGTSLYRLGLSLAVCGNESESQNALTRSLRIFSRLGFQNLLGGVKSILAQRALWFEKYTEASSLANEAWDLAFAENFERDFVRASRLQGSAIVRLNQFTLASERLHHALDRARKINLTQEELPALIALAEMQRRQGNLGAAQSLLDEVWDYVEQGPFPIEHTDALNILAHIERDAGNYEAAVKAATEAYRKAWCDGISADGKQCFAYWSGLQAARAHLKALSAQEPVLPPFDESNFEPMPVVEIDPHDEFHDPDV